MEKKGSHVNRTPFAKFHTLTEVQHTWCSEAHWIWHILHKLLSDYELL